MVIEDDAQVQNSLFALMEKSYEDEDGDDQVTLFNIKENLKNYTPAELKSLVAILFDTKDDLTRDKELFKIKLKKGKEKMAESNVQMSKLQIASHSLSVENESISEKLSEANDKMITSLERYGETEKELTR